MEHIVSFGEKITEQNRPFYIEMSGITYPDPNYHIRRHNSYIHCFEFVIDGEGVVKVDNRTNYPVKGDLYILPKGSNHDYYSLPDNPFTKIWMNVSGPLCDELIHVYGLTGILIVKQIDVLPIFNEFLKICEDKTLSLDEIHSQCSLVFLKLIMKVSEHLMSMDTRIASDTANIIKSYIDRNIYERLTIETVSHQICLSPSQINRIFKKNFDITPYEYILNRKIETAKLLLKNTSLSVKEIAYKLNFADEHYFSNIFLQKTGSRPKKFNTVQADSPS